MSPRLALLAERLIQRSGPPDAHLFGRYRCPSFTMPRVELARVLPHFLHHPQSEE